MKIERMKVKKRKGTGGNFSTKQEGNQTAEIMAAQPGLKKEKPHKYVRRFRPLDLQE